VILGRRIATRIDKNWDTLDPWRQWPIHAISGRTAAGAVITSARNPKPIPATEGRGVVTIKGLIPAVKFDQLPTLKGKIEYQRTFAIELDAIRIESVVTPNGKNKLRHRGIISNVELRDINNPKRDLRITRPLPRTRIISHQRLIADECDRGIRRFEVRAIVDVRKLTPARAFVLRDRCSQRGARPIAFRGNVVPEQEQVAGCRDAFEQGGRLRRGQAGGLRRAPRLAAVIGYTAILLLVAVSKETKQATVLQFGDGRLMATAAGGRHRIAAAFPRLEAVVRVEDKRMQLGLLASIGFAADVLLGKRTVGRNQDATRAQPHRAIRVIAIPAWLGNLPLFAPGRAVVERASHEDIALGFGIPPDIREKDLSIGQPDEIRMLHVVSPYVFLKRPRFRPRPAPILRDFRGNTAGHRVAGRLAVEVRRPVGVVLTPDQHEALVIERKDELMIVPRMRGRPWTNDLIVNRLEQRAVVFRGVCPTAADGTESEAGFQDLAA